MLNALAGILLAASFARPLERVATMDPARAQSVYDLHAIQLVYETPLAIDYAARPYRLAPGLCELPDVSDDGREYRFRLRPDAALAAEDVVRALSRLRDPSVPSPGGWTMRAVEEMKALDARTFVVRLRGRSHVFPWMMATGYAAVPAADGSGTGPYRLASWRKNHEMVFERNASWPGWAERPGAFDTLRYLVVDDPATQWLMFLKGEVDFLGSVSRDNWDAVVGPDGRLDPRLRAQGVALHTARSLDVRYFGINMRDAVLGGNRKLRQALNCAFDAPAWKAFFNGRAEPADGPVPPGIDGRLETPFAYAFDLEKARRLLAEAGYPGGIDPRTGRRLVLTLDIGRSTQDSREAGELVAGFFARVGIRLELRFRTWEAFLRAVGEGRTQLFMLGWVGDYPDAENFLQLFYSKNAGTGSNRTRYANPAFDSAFEAALAAGDAETRNAHWRACQEIVREDCPWIFGHYSVLAALTRARVGGYVPGDFPYGEEKNFRCAKEEGE